VRWTDDDLRRDGTRIAEEFRTRFLEEYQHLLHRAAVLHGEASGRGVAIPPRIAELVASAAQETARVDARIGGVGQGGGPSESRGRGVSRAPRPRAARTAGSQPTGAASDSKDPGNAEGGDSVQGPAPGALARQEGGSTPMPPTAALAVPHVRIEDPLALFVPERHLIGSVPLPLYLLELVPGSVKADYERTATGMVAQEGDRIRRRTVRYPGGVRVDIEVHGDQVRGLPTTFDYDYFLALCRIADEGGVDGQGYFVDPGYRAVLRAAGRSDDAIGGEQVEAVKRAFARFGGLILYTRLDVDYSQASGQVRSGARHPLVPDGAPPVREREGKHWVLEYDVEAERRHGASYDSIERLRINPLWLDQAAAGIAAWMDVGLHNALRSGYAKRLLQLFTVRAARGWRVLDPWVLDLRELYEALEVPPTQWGKTQTRTGVSQALATLADQGVLGQGDVVKHGKGRYEVTLVAGERLLAAGYQRGTGAADGIADRMLLWHLRASATRPPRRAIWCAPSRTRSAPCCAACTTCRRSRPGCPTAARSRTGPPGPARRSSRSTPSATRSGSAG
jgi:hypothetical protein